MVGILPSAPPRAGSRALWKDEGPEGRTHRAGFDGQVGEGFQD